MAKKPAKAKSSPVCANKTREYFWEGKKEPRTKAEIEKFFKSPDIRRLKKLICELGKRCYSRNFNDGNGGNFTVRVGKNLVLCTPTMMSKCDMTEDDICLIDMDGNQLCGKRRRTSEALAHLAIMKAQPKAKACCHAHPPYATAFATARKTPPRYVNPESEIFTGEVGLAPYRTPGTPEMAKAVGDLAREHDCIFMINHGVITWANDVEVALWKMENIEALAHTSWLAMFLDSGPRKFSKECADAVGAMRAKMDMPSAPHVPANECNMESFIDRIADRVAEKLARKGLK